MAYASLQTLTDRFGEDVLIDLTDRGDVPTGQIDADAVTKALSEAEALIDGHIGGLYALPVVAVPDLLTGFAEVIAYYKLHLYDAPTKVEADYRDALKMLKDIAAGTLRLPIEGKEPARTDANSVQTTDRARPFNPRNMSGFI